VSVGVTEDGALLRMQGTHQPTNPEAPLQMEVTFFGGLTVEETAEVLKVSPNSVSNDWKLRKDVAAPGYES